MYIFIYSTSRRSLRVRPDGRFFHPRTARTNILRPCFCVSVLPSACPSVLLRVCPPVCVSVRLSVCTSVLLRVSLCFCVSDRPSVCPSVLLRVHPPVCVSVRASACPSARLCVLFFSHPYVHHERTSTAPRAYLVTSVCVDHTVQALTVPCHERVRVTAYTLNEPS